MEIYAVDIKETIADMNGRCFNCECVKSSAYSMIKFNVKTILVFFPVKHPRKWYITGMGGRKG